MGETGHRDRAARYALRCALKFRAASSEPWRGGMLRNISESGLLFDPDGSVADAAHLEITIDFPPPGIGSIWCAAVVVRREEATQAVGARITEYRLQPRAAAPPG